MTTVLAAIDSNASGRPVLRTAIALADLLDATVTSLHVRERRASSCTKSAARRSSRSWPPPKTRTSPRSSSANLAFTAPPIPPDTPRST